MIISTTIAIRKITDITGRIFGLVVILFITLTMVVNSPRLQTFLTRQAVSALEKKLDAEIDVGSVSIKPVRSFIIKDLCIRDKHPWQDGTGNGFPQADTLLYAGSVSGSMSIWGLFFRQGVDLSRVEISDISFHMVSEPGETWASNLQRILRSKPAPEIPREGPPIFNIRRLKVNGARFRRTNMIPSKNNSGESGDWINWNRADFFIPTLEARNVAFRGGRFYITADTLSFRERSGYAADNLTFSGHFGVGEMLFSDVHLQDGWSDVQSPQILMSFRNAYSLKDFNNSVHLAIDVDKSGLSGRTLSYFVRPMPSCNLLADINGIEVEGYINDLNINRMQFRETVSGTQADIAGRLRDLTIPSEMFIDTDVKNIRFTTTGLTSLMKEISPGSGFDIRRFARNDNISFNGKARGLLRDLNASGNLSLGDGTFSTKLHLGNITVPSKDIIIRGTATATDMDLGRIIGVEALGGLTARTGFSATMTPGTPSLVIDSLIIDKLGAKGYNYSGITAAGSMTGKEYNGKIVCNDPNLNFIYQGICSIPSGSGNELYRFDASLNYADLKALHLDTRDNISSKVSCQMTSDFTMTGKLDGEGELTISGIVLDDGKAERKIGDIKVESRTGEEGYAIRMTSDIADAIYKGTETLPTLFEDLISITAGRHLPSLFPASGIPVRENTGIYDIDITFHDSRELLAFLKPGLYIADSTRVSLQVNGNGDMNALMYSPRLAIGKNYLKGADFKMNNIGGMLNATLSNNEIKGAGARIRQSILTASAARDSILLNLHFVGKDNEQEYGDLITEAAFARDAQDSLMITILPRNSHFFSNEALWDIDDSRIIIRGKKISVEQFRVSSGEQQLCLDGGVSPFSRDTLNLDVSRIVLGMVSSLSGNQIDLDGTAGGHATLISPLGDDMQVYIDMSCDSLGVGKNEIGDLSINGSWDKANDRLTIDIRDSQDGRFPLIAHGFIYPDTKDIDISAQLKDLNIAIAEPFLAGLFSDMSGFITGNISLSGNLDSPQINTSGLYLNTAVIKLDVTGTTYTLDGPISLDDEGIKLDGVSIKDKKNGTAQLSGGILYDNFKRDLEMDAGIRMKGLQILDLPETRSEGIYGNLSASGSVNVKGPFNDLGITGFVATAGDGQVHVPLNTAVASSNSDLLTFKEKEGPVYVDPYEEMIKEEPVAKKVRNNVHIHMRANATPDVLAILELNKATGNVITAGGNASVLFDMEKATGNINLEGDYRINGGKLHFEIPGIVKKEFELNDGSTIKFNGDPKDSEVNINASYRLKTSLSALLSDTTSVSSRRLVVCTINMKGSLHNPEINFGVDVPDLAPDSRAKMAEALNTPDKVQKQFIALLVMGTFLPNEQSGVVNGTNILYSNMSEIMSNQLNNILQRLDIPLDLGLGYQQSQGGTNIFDVAISTQLFNNRVEIGGTLGNRQYKTSKNPNGEVVGDIDISIKLDKSGMFKLNLFSHSADEYTSFLDLSQRNGIGVNYSKEYNNFWQMLKELFTPKKKKEQQMPERNSRNTEKRIIRIEK